MATAYSEHAAYWDWDMYDDSETYAFWHTMSGRYGRRVLSAMGAIGQAGAYIAQNGSDVTVLDYTEEMVSEGKKRFGHIKGLEYVRADIRAFELARKDYDFCFISGQDIHLLPSHDAIQEALLRIRDHLRDNGGLGLEVCYPPKASHAFSTGRIDPRVPRNDGTVIWKENEGGYDAATRLHIIRQTIHVERNGASHTFDHNITLRYYDRAQWLDAFKACGFTVSAEYSGYTFETSVNPDDNNIFNLTKR